MIIFNVINFFHKLTKLKSFDELRQPESRIHLNVFMSSSLWHSVHNIHIPTHIAYNRLDEFFLFSEIPSIIHDAFISYQYH